MGQINLIRTQFKGWADVTTPANSANQEVDRIEYFRTGDSVTVLDVDACGNVISTLASGVTVNGIDPINSVLFLDSAVDTTAATGTAVIVADAIDDGQEAIDRLYETIGTNSAADINFDVTEAITGQTVDSPIVGQSTLTVADAGFLEVGETYNIITDDGLEQTVTIVSVDINGDEANNQATVVIDSNTAIVGANPYLLSTDYSVEEALIYLREQIDKIDQPIENEVIGVGDCLPVYETANYYLPGSLKVLLDGVRKMPGTAGTRATLVQGTGDSALTFTSMILGTDGNTKVQVEVVSGAGLGVTVTGNYATGFLVQVNDNGGAATSQEIAEAINADATASRLVQVQWGGAGTGVVTAFGPSNLAGGLDDGTGEVVELAPVINNQITLTGYKFFAFRLDPNDRNRMNAIPQGDEDILVDYRRALVNA